MKYPLASVLICSVALTACTYDVATVRSPQLDVYSNYANKLPGKWALIVDDQALREDVHAEGLACAAHSFPLDLTSSFRQSTIATFQNMADQIDLRERPMPMEEIGAQGYAGEIEVRADQLRTRLNLIPGFWSAKADADVEIDAGLIVTGPSGRLLGTRASGDGHETSDAGEFCGGATDAIGNGAETAMKNVLGELGERFGNAPQLRSASYGAGNQAGGYVAAAPGGRWGGPNLGVEGSTVTAASTSAVFLKSDPHGAFISNVEANGPAWAAGIRVGDVILSLDDQRIDTFEDLGTRVGRFSPGSNHKLTFERRGDFKTVDVRF